MIELLNIDCIEYMKTCTDKQFDLAIIDPPYGIGLSSKKQSNFGKNGINHEYKEWDIVPTAEYWKELMRVSKNQIVWGGNYFTDYLPISRCWLSWYKMQEFSTNEFELAWTSFDATCKQFNLSRVQSYANQNKIHPAEKPKRLYNWILKNYATAGMKILDTHLGSGNIAISCHYAEMNFVGCEIDKGYYDKAMKNFKDGTAQTSLFLKQKN